MLAVQYIADDWRDLFEKSNVVLLEIGGETTGELAFWLRLHKHLSEYYSKLQASGSYDIVVSSRFPMNIVASRFLTVPKAQLLYEPYAAFYDPIWLNSWSFFRRLLYRMQKLLYVRSDIRATQKADVILTLSRSNQEWIRQVYGVNSIPIYEGVDTELFQPTVNTALQEKYAGFDVLLHLTRFEQIKGTKELVAALPTVLTQFPKVKLLIPGKYRGHAEDRLMQLANRLHVEHVIERVGFIPDEMLPAYYSLAKIVVQPSLNQPQSLPSKEAMSCGTPVIRGMDAIEEVVDGQTGILVDARDPKAIGEAISSLLANSSLRQQMGIRARQHIVDNFTWERVFDSVQSELVSLTRLQLGRTM